MSLVLQQIESDAAFAAKRLRCGVLFENRDLISDLRTCALTVSESSQHWHLLSEDKTEARLRSLASKLRARAADVGLCFEADPSLVGAATLETWCSWATVHLLSLMVLLQSSEGRAIEVAEVVAVAVRY